ncbi:3924_t:CDS:2, partial [Dentiscutata heterogama]
ENVEKSLLVDPDNELAADELQQILDIFEEEKIDIHQQFNDNDFIQGVTKIEQVENDVITQLLTRKEQLDILCNALKIVNKRNDDGEITMRSLYKLQSHIQEEVRKEEAEKQVQSTLDQFLSRPEQ